MPSLHLLAIPAILFVATLVRSTFGFGEALVSVPLLALFLPVQVAAPIAVLASITVALVVVLQDWRHVHLKSAGALLIASALGIPLGLWLLKAAPEAMVKILLGGIILGFSAFSLRRRAPPMMVDDRLAAVFGLMAGVLGGAYGMNGPPLAVYGAMRRWSPAHFRATLQGYFLVASALGMIGYWQAGLCTHALGVEYLRALPAVLVAIPIGRALNKKLHPERFHRWLYWGLCVIGLVLLLEALPH
jgi:uncharacterized membrane protein YfcA